jgi:RND superfamily putative drug exporter
MHGVGADLLGVQHVGSVIALMPMLCMGVLFGLAMDYQLFIVSPMRERYVRDGAARAALIGGYTSSAQVVAAAAAIMLSVFASFVPDGTADTKPVAFTLAVGVVIDAFVVRATLIPAVLALLGDRAWWLPAVLQRRLPFVDAEGDGLGRELRAAAGAARRGAAGVPVVLADRLTIRDGQGRPVLPAFSCTVRPGEIVAVVGPAATNVLLALGGRLTAFEGDLAVCGLALPGRRHAVRKVAALVTRNSDDPVDDAIAALDDHPALLLVDGAEALSPPDRDRLSRRVELPRPGSTAGPGSLPGPAVVLGFSTAAAAASWPGPLTGTFFTNPSTTVLSLVPGPPSEDRPRRRVRPSAPSSEVQP